MPFICNCEYVLWVALRWNGRAYVPVFLDKGQVVTHCPGCGEALAPLWYERPANRKTHPPIH